MNKGTTVYYNKRPVYEINSKFLDKQNAWGNLDLIKEVHQFKLAIIDLMSETEDSVKLKSLAADVTECEFELQRLFKLKKDASYHRFWLLPHCSCSKMDNEDNYPSGHYYLSSNCPVHGS